MNSSVARLIRRLLPLVASAAVSPKGEALTLIPAPSRDPDHDEPGLARSEEFKTQKLVFGVARAGQPQLLAHGSHRSHSSHSSHSSHYSSSSGGSTYTPPAPAPTPAPQEVPKEKPPKKASPRPEEQNPPAVTPEMALVLKKLPLVRSQWPAEAKLTKPAEFNIYDGDQVVGVVRLMAGTKVKVVEITLQHALVRVGRTQSPLPVAYTDIVEIMGGAARILALPDDAVPAPNSKG